MKLILTPHFLLQCDTQLWNNNVPRAETLIPLGPGFHSTRTFLCCSVNGRQDLIFHTSKQHSLVKETFITLNTQWKRNVIWCDYVGCLFCLVLSSLLEIDWLYCCESCGGITSERCCRLCFPEKYKRKSIYTHSWKYHLSFI